MRLKRMLHGKLTKQNELAFDTWFVCTTEARQTLEGSLGFEDRCEKVLKATQDYIDLVKQQYSRENWINQRSADEISQGNTQLKKESWELAARRMRASANSDKLLKSLLGDSSEREAKGRDEGDKGFHACGGVYRFGSPKR